MTRVVVGIGSNESPHANVCTALELLDTACGPLRRSPVYRCAPVGFAGADFLNLVAVFETLETLQSVQARLCDIEAACGRDRDRAATAGRMDIDLLLFGDTVRASAPRLPCPDIVAHAFVLKPLAELLPEARHPLCKRRYRQLWADFGPSDSVLEAVALEQNVPPTGRR
jgi:2-amino-4-hydroxy-6-hydroxymethyldihydropteridine diphosphokinase